MQYVNDDMDELFRKAAKDYPLDTRGSDWSKIAAALQNEEPLPARKNNGRRFLWLLLLLPLGLVCNHFWNNGGRQMASTSGNSAVTTGGTEKTGASLPSDNTHTKVPANAAATTSHSVAISSNTVVPGKKSGSSSDASVNREEPASLQIALTGSGKNKRKEVALNTAGSEKIVSISESGTPGSKTGGRSASGNKGRLNGQALDGTGKTTSNNFIPGKSAGRLEQEAHSDEVFIDRSLRNIKVNGFPSLGVTGPIDAHFDTLVKNAPAIRVNNRRKHLYMGVMTGLDATTIHFQKVQDAGYEYGVLLGYHLNRKWSVETGVYIDRKFYYTSGQYFNSVKLYMPPNSKITEVAGNCRMIELPLNVHYLFSAKPHASWYAGAGLSSYLMKKEDYAYQYYYGNSNTYATHNWSYNNSSKNYFSVLNLSAGYTTRLGKIASLRVEPYLKIPVKGLGYNNIRMVSGGLHLGFTRELF